MNQDTDKGGPLEELAARQFTPLNGTPDSQAQQEQDAAEAAQAAQEEAAVRMMEAAAHRIALGLLKLGRSAVGKRLPAIHDEWTDQVLQDPAAAAVPLMRRHFEGIMQLAGANPDLAAFVVACLPLGLGLINAMDRQAKTVDVQAREVEPA